MSNPLAPDPRRPDAAEKVFNASRDRLRWSRWSLVPITTGVILMLWLLVLALHKELWVSYHWTLESSQWPIFSDLDVVLSGMRLRSEGVDPLVLDYSAHGFIYNYPRLWLAFRFLHFQDIPLPLFGFALGCSWIVIAVAITGLKSPTPAVLMSLLLVSPPVLLALERANVDLILFLLCILATFVTLRGRFAWLAPVCFGFGALLKIYPLFGLALVAFERSPRRRAWWVAVAIGIAIAWAFQIDELSLVASRTPRISGASIGCAVLATRYVHYLESALQLTIPPFIWIGASLFVYGSVLAVAASIGRRFPREVLRKAAPSELLLFGLSASICCGTFALGNNFAYRLIFLVPSLPLFWRMFADREAPDSWRYWANTGLCAIGVSFFSPLWSNGRIFIMAQVANWIAIASLAAGFTAIVIATWQSDRTDSESSIRRGELEDESTSRT